jgi:hypothetical protein
VLLTHASPRGVGDADDGPHQGFTALHGLVAALQPTALLHGHVHRAAIDHSRMGRTVVSNVTGWHLLEITPRGGIRGVVPPGQQAAGVTELLPGRRHAR